MQSVIYSVISEYLSDSDVKPELQLSLWAGHCELREIDLNCEALARDTGLPVVGARVRRLFLSVPWSSLYTQSVVIEISGLHLEFEGDVVTPASDGGSDDVHDDDDDGSTSVGGIIGGGVEQVDEETITARLLSTIRDNVSLKITDVSVSWGTWLDVHINHVVSQPFHADSLENDEVLGQDEYQRFVDIQGVSSPLISAEQFRVLLRPSCVEVSSTGAVDVNVDVWKLLSELPAITTNNKPAAALEEDQWSWLLVNIPLLSVNISKSMEMLDLNLFGVVPVVAFPLVRLDFSCIECKIATLGKSIELLCNSMVSIVDLYTEDTQFPVLLDSAEVEIRMIDNQLDVTVQESCIYLPPLLLKQFSSQSDSHVSELDDGAKFPVELHLAMIHPSLILCRDFTDASTSMIIVEAQDLHMDNDGGVINALQLSTLYDQEMAFVVLSPTNVQFSNATKAGEVMESSMEIQITSLALSIERAELQQGVTILEEVLEDMVAAVKAPIARSYSKTSIHISRASAIILDGVAHVAELLVEDIGILASSYVSRKSQRIMEIELNLKTILLLDRTTVEPQLIISTLPPSDIKPLISVVDLFDSPAYAKIKKAQNSGTRGHAFALRYETRRYHNRVPHIRISFDAQDIRVRHVAAFFERLSLATDFGIAGLDNSSARSLKKLSRTQLMWQYFAFRLKQRKKALLFSEGKRIPYGEARSLPSRSTHWLTWNSLSFYLQSVITKLSFHVRRLQLIIPGNTQTSGIECFIDSIDCTNSKQGLQFSSHLLNISVSGLEAKLLQSSQNFLSQPKISCTITTKSNKSVDGEAISKISCQMASVRVALDDKGLKECVDVLRHANSNSEIVVPQTYSSPSRKRHMTRIMMEQRTVIQIDSVDVSVLGIRVLCSKGAQLTSTSSETSLMLHQFSVRDMSSGEGLINPRLRESILKLQRGSKTVNLITSGYSFTFPSEACLSRILTFANQFKKSPDRGGKPDDLLIGLDVTAMIHHQQMEISLNKLCATLRVDHKNNSLRDLTLKGDLVDVKDIVRARNCEIDFDHKLLSVNVAQLKCNLERILSLPYLSSTGGSNLDTSVVVIPVICGRVDRLEVELPNDFGCLVGRSIVGNTETRTFTIQNAEWSQCALVGLSLTPQGLTCDRIDLRVEQVLSLNQLLSNAKANPPPVRTDTPRSIEWQHDSECTLHFVSFNHNNSESIRPELVRLERWAGENFDDCGPLEIHPRDTSAQSVPVQMRNYSTRWRLAWEVGSLSNIEVKWKYKPEKGGELPMPFDLKSLDVICPRVFLRHSQAELALHDVASNVAPDSLTLSCDASLSTSLVNVKCSGFRLDLRNSFSVGEITLARKVMFVDILSTPQFISVTNNAVRQLSLFTLRGRRLCDVAPLGGTATIPSLSVVHNVAYGDAKSEFKLSSIAFSDGTRLIVHLEANELVIRSVTSVVDATGCSLQLLHSKPDGVFLSQVTEELIVGEFRSLHTSSGKGKEEESIWDHKLNETPSTWQRKRSPLDTTIGSTLKIRGGRDFSWSAAIDISVEGKSLMISKSDEETIFVWCCIDTNGLIRLNPPYLFQNKTGVPLWGRVMPQQMDLCFDIDEEIPLLCDPDRDDFVVHLGFSETSLSEAHISLADTKSVLSAGTAKLYVYVVKMLLTNSRVVMINTPIRLVNLMDNPVTFGQVSFKRLVEEFVIGARQSRAYFPPMATLPDEPVQFCFGRAFEFNDSLRQCQHLLRENSRLNYYMGTSFTLERRAEFASTFQVPLCLEKPELCSRNSMDIVTCYDYCVHIMFNRATRTHEISVRGRYSVVNRSSCALTIFVDSEVIQPKPMPLGVSSSFHISQWTCRRDSIYDSPRFRIGGSPRFSSTEPGHAWLIELPDPVSLRTICLSAVSRRVSEHRVEVELRDAEPPFIICNFTASPVWIREQWSQRQVRIERGQQFPLFPESYRDYIESQRAAYVTDEGEEDEKSFTVAPTTKDISQFPLSLRKLPLHLSIKCGSESKFQSIEITRARTVHLNEYVTCGISLENTAKVLTLRTLSHAVIIKPGIALRVSVQVQYVALRIGDLLEATVENFHLVARTQPQASVARLEASLGAVQAFTGVRRLVRTNGVKVKAVASTPFKSRLRELWLEFADMIRVDVDYLEITKVIERSSVMFPPGQSSASVASQFFVDRFEMCPISMVVSLQNSLLSVQNLSLRLDSLEHEGCSISLDELSNELVKEYLKVQLLGQSVRILGSLDIVGNPAGVTDALARGVTDFTEGIKQGRVASVALLFRGVAEAATTSLIGFTRAGSQLTAGVSSNHGDGSTAAAGAGDDDDDDDTRNTSTSSGGGGGLWSAISGAARGLIREPALGLGSAGIQGMLGGLGRALRGLAAPARASFDSASRTLTIVHDWMGADSDAPDDLPRVDEFKIDR